MKRLEKLEALIKHFNGALKSLSLYPATHPASARFFAKIQESLEELFQEKEEVAIGVVEEALVLEDMPLKASQEVFLGFASRLKEREVGSVVFFKGIALEEVRAFVEALRMEAGALKAQGGMGQVLAQRGVQHIKLTAPFVPEEPVEEDFEKIQARIIYERALGVAREVFEAARLGKIPSLPEVRRMVEAIMDGIFKDKYAYLALTMIKSYDEYLFTHSVNVGILAIALGEALGLDKETLRELGLGAMLHDLGKVNWPDSLHKKPRGLSEDEWRIVKRHPLDGARMVEKMGGISP
ncbi:MAG: HD-GYP domain-containing protein, partial [Candidatus Methylomirabilales bacterium]